MSIFTDFDSLDDIKPGQISIVSSGMWSGGVGTLTSFYTSSTQSGSTGEHYYDVYNGVVGTNATASVQFSVAYGHYAGSGSLTGDSNYAASKAIYRQLRNLLLPQGTEKFQAGAYQGGGTDADTDVIWAVSMNRGRLKEKMDPGNWELRLQQPGGGKIIHLIDDSGATSDPNVRNTVREFNVISGSIATGTAVIGAVSAATHSFGKFYPETGILVLDSTKINDGGASGISMSGYNTASNTAGNNASTFFDAISSGSYFAARREEQIKSTHYFCRVRHNQYNHSQNPTYTSGSNGDLTVASFRNDPKSYITTVGLYNGANELLAVAKLSKPILKSSSREALIKVRLDF
tara:strand:+ start:1461 stop:2501 length:1041 start_codon:yes stop_codon:yes gene_type:complete